MSKNGKPRPCLGWMVGGTPPDAVLLRGGTLLASVVPHQPSGFAGFTRGPARAVRVGRRFRRT